MSKLVKLELNSELHHLATVKIATLLWGHSVLKKKIKDCLQEKPNVKLQGNKSWYAIVKEVIQNSQSLRLPGKVEQDLKDVIILIGERMYHWAQYVLTKLEFDLSFVEFRFTEQGFIDEKAVFRIWEKNVCSRNFENSFNLLMGAACMFGMEDFILKNKTKILNKLKKMYNLKNIQKQEPFWLMAMWLCKIMERETLVGLSVSQSHCGFTSLKSIEDIFKSFVYTGHNYFLKYLWEQMTLAQRKKSVYDTCKKEIILRDPFKFQMFEYDSDYKREKVVEAIVFVINHMDEKVRLEMFRRHGRFLLGEFIFISPFEKFFPYIFNKTKIHFLFHDEFKMLFNYVVRSTCSTAVDDELFNLYKNIYQKKLDILWNSMTVEMKLKIVGYDDIFSDLISCFPNLSALKLVINDESLKTQRKSMLDECRKVLQEEILEGDFEFFEQFLHEVLQSSEERKDFKKKLKGLEEFIECDQYNNADKLVKILADEEVKVDCVGICKKLIRFDDKWREKADKFLNSQFVNPEDVANVKNEIIKSEDYLYDKITEPFLSEAYFLCFHDTEFKVVDEAKKICSEFLDWLLGAEKGNFDLAKNEKFIEHYFAGLFKHYYVNDDNFTVIMDEFLKFFEVSYETYSNVRERMREKVSDWIDICVEKHCNFQIANALVSWLARNEKQKEEIIRNYVNSPKGVWFYEKTFASIELYGVECVMDFLNKWVKPYGKLEEIKNKLESLETEKKSAMISLINILKSGRSVVKKNVEIYVPSEGDVFDGVVDAY